MSHEALPPRSVVPEGPPVTETGGKAQEALSQDRRTEGRQVIGDLQSEDPKREEIPKESRHRQEERDAPAPKRSMPMLQTKGSRTSPITGRRSCPPITRGVGGGIQRAARDHLDPHTEEKAQEGKSALSLRGVVRKALEAVSAWALSLLGVTWKVLQTAPSWNMARGALARVPRGSRRRENCQTREGLGQRKKVAAPGSQL